MKKYLILTTSILLLAAACQKQASVQPISNQPVQNQNQATSTAETANWKTYTSDKYGFQFRYLYKNLSVADGYVSSIDPKGMIAVVNIFKIPHGQDKDGEVRIFDSPLDKAAESVGFGSGALSIAKTVTINDINWTILYASETQARGHYLTERNGKTFWLDVGNSVNDSDFQIILSTFKFTK